MIVSIKYNYQVKFYYLENSIYHLKLLILSNVFSKIQKHKKQSCSYLNETIMNKEINYM